MERKRGTKREIKYQMVYNDNVVAARLRAPAVCVCVPIYRQVGRALARVSIGTGQFFGTRPRTREAPRAAAIPPGYDGISERRGSAPRVIKQRLGRADSSNDNGIHSIIRSSNVCARERGETVASLCRDYLWPTGRIRG